MLDWFTDAFQALVDFLYACFLFIIEIPMHIIKYLWDLWTWCQEKLLMLTYNLLVDGFFSVLSRFGYDMGKPRQVLHQCYQVANVFFPMEDVFKLAVFLIQTYIAVALFGRLAAIVLRFVTPARPWKVGD